MGRFVFLLVIVLLIGAGGYWYWTTTPQYAALAIHSAIKNHDLNTFEKYVDIDNVASAMVDSILSRPAQQALGRGFIGQVLGYGIGFFVKPALEKSMRQEIIDYVRGASADDTSLLDSEVRPVSMHVFRNIPKQLGFTGKIFRGIDYVHTDGKLSLIGLKLYNMKYDQSMILELKFVDAGGYWRLAELSNLGSLLEKIVNLQLQSEKEGQPRTILPQAKSILDS